MAVKLIAFDLDYTMLDSRKHLSADNLSALCEAAAKGIYTVPATGRIYTGVPEELRSLPFMRWYILGNGARIYDALEDKTVCSLEIPLETCMALFDYADSFGLRYDCYAGDTAWMERSIYEHLSDFVKDPGTYKLLHDIRHPVDDLRGFLCANFSTVLKAQIYFDDPTLRLEMLEKLPLRFPELNFSSSLPINIEVNSREANKGSALTQLAKILGLEKSETLAFGDGLNDLDMLLAAGNGVAMLNAEEKLKAAADNITGHCDESGVAEGIRRFAF